MTPRIDLPPDLVRQLEAMDAGDRARGRPWVTLTYAQSLDGSIAAQRGTPLALSGRATLEITHHLRARHAAILIGIGTLLADDPRLTVRLAPGEHPQPVVLDRQLRTPLTARLLRGPKPPWIFTTTAAPSEREAALGQAGARLFRLPPPLDLADVLTVLYQERLASLMVEGGAGVITAFLQAQFVDFLVLTIAPRLIGGLCGVESRLPGDGPHLEGFGVHRYGDDLLVWGTPRGEFEA
jgi:3,4-dihydroxy 2-butanone 4-phosphate synthase/GTP cyclohydrolase II